MSDAQVFAALASPRRPQVLQWLEDPRAHFPPRREGDLVDETTIEALKDRIGEELR